MKGKESVQESTLGRSSAHLFVAHCVCCKANYYPDKIIFKDNENNLQQRLDCDAEYIRISKNGIWAHQKLGHAQEKAVARFHSGWLNFADWMNETTKVSHFLTYRQSKRLFIEYMGRRLLVEHHHSDTFTCPPNTNSDLLCQYIRDIIGQNCGVIDSSMTHGCMDCTHPKCYRIDLVREGLILEDNPAMLSDNPMTENEALDDIIVRLNLFL